MKIYETSPYENEIDQLIKKYGEELVSEGLRSLIRDFDDIDKEIFIDPAVIKSVISHKNGKKRITRADLQKLVKDSLFSNLDTEINLSRAEVIYKHLNLVNVTTHPPTSELDKEFRRIRDEKIFPKPKDSLHREGSDGKYKAITNLTENDHSTAKDHTLKFGMAVLGINLERMGELLSDYADSPQQSSIPQEKTEAKKEKTNHIKFVLTVIIGTMLIAIISFVTFQFSKSNANHDDIEPGRQEINTSEILGRPFDIPVTLQDSAFLIFTKINSPTIISTEETKHPVNDVILRFKLVNQTNEFLFPDILEIYVKGRKAIQNVIVTNPSILQSEDIYNIDIKPEQEAISVVLINDENYRGIPAHTEVSGLIRLSAPQVDSPTILNYDLVIKCHSSRKEYLLRLPNQTLVATVQ